MDNIYLKLVAQQRESANRGHIERAAHWQFATFDFRAPELFQKQPGLVIREERTNSVRRRVFDQRPHIALRTGFARMINEKKYVIQCYHPYSVGIAYRTGIPYRIGFPCRINIVLLSRLLYKFYTLYDFIANIHHCVYEYMQYFYCNTMIID